MRSFYESITNYRFTRPDNSQNRDRSHTFMGRGLRLSDPPSYYDPESYSTQQRLLLVACKRRRQLSCIKLVDWGTDLGINSESYFWPFFGSPNSFSQLQNNKNPTMVFNHQSCFLSCFLSLAIDNTMAFLFSFIATILS